ncbi:Protein singed [Halotydeus destructor]|nr:Protein singed [Halotydeus destructor]
MAMWSQTVGLVNGQHKYLTAETFGHKVNANGLALKKKQLWSLEPFQPFQNGASEGQGNEHDAELEHVAIKSHLGCYLAVDNFGNITCNSTELSEGACFTISICSMNGQLGDQIYWAFRNQDRGYYLGTTSDGTITCVAKMPQSKSELWNVHLVPSRGMTMFALKSISRKRYARTTLDNNGDQSNLQVELNAINPWGPEMLFQLRYFEGGLHALLTSDCKYLTCDGAIVTWTPDRTGEAGKTVTTLPPRDTLFTIEYHEGSVAFRDHQGRYLTAVGRAATMRTRANNVSKDELFEFEAAPIQVALRANVNNKWVSIKQGVDVTANQSDISNEHETFQLESDSEGCWRIRTNGGHYWGLEAASAIQTSSNDVKSAGHFRLKYNAEDGSCNLLVASKTGDSESTPKWICARKSGHLYTGTDPVGLFIMFQNRTSLNLRALSSSGFVGLKLPGTFKVEASKTVPDSVVVEYANSENNQDTENSSFNCCFLKMPINNKYWSVSAGNLITCDQSFTNCAQQFLIELRSGSTIAIRLFESSNYLSLTSQGALIVKGCPPEEATLWEF